MTIARADDGAGTITILGDGGGGATCDLSPGTYSIVAEAFPEAAPMGVPPASDSAAVAGEAGDQTAIALNVRTAVLMVRFTSDLPLGETMPRVAVEIAPTGSDDVARSGRAAPDGTFSVEALPLGRYTVAAGFNDPERGIFAPFIAANETVEVKAGTETIDVPVAFARVDVALETAVPEGFTLDAFQVVEMQSKGEPYASVKLDGAMTASLVYIPLPGIRTRSPLQRQPAHATGRCRASSRSERRHREQQRRRPSRSGPIATCASISIMKTPATIPVPDWRHAGHRAHRHGVRVG